MTSYLEDVIVTCRHFNVPQVRIFGQLTNCDARLLVKESKYVLFRKTCLTDLEIYHQRPVFIGVETCITS